MSSGRSARAVTRITVWGALCNVVLSGLKLLVGTMVGSISLVADGAHSLSDLATDGVVLVGAWISARPPDKGHPYGHGKFEEFCS